MSNNYAPCYNRIDFVVIPSYIELPCYSGTLFCVEYLKLFSQFQVNEKLLAKFRPVAYFYVSMKHENPQLAFTCTKSAMETSEQHVKSVQSQ